MTAATFAGLPASRWLFAIRTWLAIHLALGLAFWVQLDGAESAGVIAAMLSVQTRGQTLEKGIYCFLGTVVGGAISIAIVGPFAQVRDLYMLTYSLWLAVCVFGAGFLDGNRAYGAVVCGYTVSVVAVIHIDDPNGLFLTVINRCAAITIGIASLLLIVDVLAGPEIGADLLGRVKKGIRKAQSFADDLVRNGPTRDADARMVALMGAASNQHLLLTALPVEALSGSARAGAVRATLAALMGEIRAARALAVVRQQTSEFSDPQFHDLIRKRLTDEMLTQRATAAQAFSAASAGRAYVQAPRMPIYRSWENAARNALRAFVASMLVGTLFILAGWPQTSFSWAMTGIFVCLSANSPDPAALTKATLIAFPAAIILGGITQFGILGGVDQFPLFMIGTAPTLLATLLLASSPKPALAGIGLLTTVYTIIIIQPSNPQSYDPQSYVILALLLLTTALLAFTMANVVLPTSEARRRRWIFASARRNLRAALRGFGPQGSEDEHRLFDASLIGTLASLGGRSVRDRNADLALALRMSDLALAARRVRRALDALTARDAADSRTRDLVYSARVALATANADSLRQCGLEFAETTDEARLALAADLAWTAELMDSPADPNLSPRDLR